MQLWVHVIHQNLKSQRIPKFLNYFEIDELFDDTLLTLCTKTVVYMTLHFTKLIVTPVQDRR